MASAAWIEPRGGGGAAAAAEPAGVSALELTVRSRATMDRPIRLEARTLDGAVRAEQAITVSPCAASHRDHGAQQEL